MTYDLLVNTIKANDPTTLSYLSQKREVDLAEERAKLAERASENAALSNVYRKWGGADTSSSPTSEQPPQTTDTESWSEKPSLTPSWAEQTQGSIPSHTQVVTTRDKANQTKQRLDMTRQRLSVLLENPLATSGKQGQAILASLVRQEQYLSDDYDRQSKEASTLQDKKIVAISNGALSVLNEFERNPIEARRQYEGLRQSWEGDIREELTRNPAFSHLSEEAQNEAVDSRMTQLGIPKTLSSGQDVGMLKGVMAKTLKASEMIQQQRSEDIYNKNLQSYQVKLQQMQNQLALAEAKAAAAGAKSDDKELVKITNGLQTNLNGLAIRYQQADKAYQGWLKAHPRPSGFMTTEQDVQVWEDTASQQKTLLDNLTTQYQQVSTRLKEYNTKLDKLHSVGEKLPDVWNGEKRPAGVSDERWAEYIRHEKAKQK